MCVAFIWVAPIKVSEFFIRDKNNDHKNKMVKKNY